MIPPNQLPAEATELLEFRYGVGALHTVSHRNAPFHLAALVLDRPPRAFAVLGAGGGGGDDGGGDVGGVGVGEELGGCWASPHWCPAWGVAPGAVVGGAVVALVRTLRDVVYSSWNAFV